MEKEADVELECAVGLFDDSQVEAGGERQSIEGAAVLRLEPLGIVDVLKRVEAHAVVARLGSRCTRQV